jgi:hypothetical protein
MIATNLIESMLIEMIVFKIANMIELLVDMVGLISFKIIKKLGNNKEDLFLD